MAIEKWLEPFFIFFAKPGRQCRHCRECALQRRLCQAPVFSPVLVAANAATTSQPHQLTDVFYRRAAVGNHLVVVFPEIEIFAKLLLRGRAKIEMFADANEVSRELRRCEPRAF